MRSLLSQFKREKTANGTTLSWPGTDDGLPLLGFNGDKLLRQQELENVPFRTMFNCRMFCLWKAEDQVAYVDIRNKVAAGWFVEQARHDTYIDEHKHWQIYYEWLEIYRDGSNIPV